jgi:hypothetical protein
MKARCHPLDKTGLPRTQITNKGYEIARFQKKSQTLSQCSGFVRVSRYDRQQFIPA